jgi:hypothetical protein
MNDRFLVEDIVGWRSAVKAKVVTGRTTYFNIKKPWILPTRYIDSIRMILKMNTDSFSKQH